MQFKPNKSGAILVTVAMFLGGIPRMVFAARASGLATLPNRSAAFAGGMPGDDLACKPVFDATDKLLSVSNHAYLTQSRDTPTGAKTENSESISVNGVRYIMVRGQWTRSKITPQQTKEQEEENKKNAKNYRCHFVCDETVNGEAVALYSSHNETEFANSDSQVWIAKSRGLILKQEIVLDSGGTAAKDRWSIRYDYNNVKAPEL